MTAPISATIPPLKVVRGRKNDKTIGSVVVITVG